MTAYGGTLRLARSEDPSRVAAFRNGVADDAWHEIALALGADTAGPSAALDLPANALLRGRRALLGVLRRHGVALDADTAIRVLLAAAVADDSTLDDALSGPPAGDEMTEDDAALLKSGPLRLVRVLRPFQRRDLARLLRLAHGANFSVPGAGKTTVAYALHAAERARQRVDRLLVVAPLSAFGAWEEDAAVLEPTPTVARWTTGPTPAADVVLLNYQRLTSLLPAIAGTLSVDRTHLIVDEAHRAKRGALGEWGRALLAVAPLAARRDILTGTPAPNHPRDLAALLDVVWPGGGASARLPRAALRADPHPVAMSLVNDAIRPLYARTTKTELDLPPARVVSVPVDMGPLQRDIYDALLNRYTGMLDLDRRDAAMFAQLGEVAMYLLQAASSPRLLATGRQARSYAFPPLAVPAGSRLAALIDAYPDHEVPAKVAAACRIVHNNARQGRKTLLWSNFPDNLLDLELQLAALRPALIYGAVPSAEDADPGVRTRERELDRFRSDPGCQVLLANPAALAEGVSLHTICHDAVYLDRTFNAGQYLQSVDRIHRLGLPPEIETRITVLTARGTIDERVGRRLQDKTERLAQMLDDAGLAAMSLPDDEDSQPALDEDEDFLSVMAHLAGRPDR